ncbi:MAG: hypothetical protein Q8P13_01730 [bacterium]|nr:hypothetical protein [bacterium]
MKQLFAKVKAGLTSIALGSIVWLLRAVMRWFPKNLRAVILFQLGLGILIFGWFWIGRRMNSNLRLLRPDLNWAQRLMVTVRNIWTLTRAWTFLLSNEEIAPEDMQARVEGAEPLLESYNAGTKTIVAFVHIAVNELVPAVSALGVRAFAPAEAIPELLYQAMARLRARHGNVEFTRISRGQTLPVCRQKLAEGWIVVLALDMIRQAGSGGVLCRLGTAKGYFPVGAVKLALEEEASLWLALPYYDQKGVARLRIEGPFELTRTGEVVADIESNTCRLVAAYESFILERLADWWQLPWVKLTRKE